MSKKLDRASTIAVALTMLATIATAAGSDVAAQARMPVLMMTEPQPQFTAEPVIQQLPAQDVAADALPEIGAGEAAPVSASSLADLVASQPKLDELPRELNCLAGAVYFEAKSESLNGQLAVARVIVARSKSGRFPNSYCGVVFQPSQFSFVQGNQMPTLKAASLQWKKAVAIAQIAHAGSWRSPVEGALYFHAARVSPGWRLTRIAQIENHVFYR